MAVTRCCDLFYKIIHHRHVFDIFVDTPGQTGRRNITFSTFMFVRPFIPLLPTCEYDVLTRSSAVAERPRNASCHWIFRLVTQGYSRSLKMVPFYSFGTISYSRTIVTMAWSCIIFEIKRDICLKSRFFHSLQAFDVPVRGGGSLSEYCRNIWSGKN